jgi:hypothetical protein
LHWSGEPGDQIPPGKDVPIDGGSVAMEITTVTLSEQRYLEIRAAAESAAGPQASLRLRARGYLNLYHASNGVCHFALIAAHGALWASWYLVCAKMAAMVFAITDPTVRLSPRKRYRNFADYVDVLKDINKLVMVETYVLVHTLQDLGPDFAAQKGIPADLAKDYALAMSGTVQSTAFLRDLYHRHFLWEQERVVSSKLDDAFAAFRWPFMKGLCERPWVWFSYFRAGQSLNFHSFTDQAERVEKGLIAYDRAQGFGPDRLAKVTSLRLRFFPGTMAWTRGFRPTPIKERKAKQGDGA